MFSIIIPTYNRLKELQNCLNSLSEQTFLDFEVVIVDDLSVTEVSKSIIPDNYPFKILISRNEINCGAATSRNRGIKLCKYEWIAFLDDDDIWTRDKLEIVNSVIRNQPNIDFIYHNSKIILINEHTHYFTFKKTPNDYFRTLLVKNIIGGTSMVVLNRSLITKYGGFDEEMRSLEDYELWIRLSKNFRPILIEDSLTEYFYKTNYASISKNIDSNLNSLKYINSKYSEDYYKLTKREFLEKYEWQDSMIAHKFLLNYNRINASRYYLKAFSRRFRLKFLAASLFSLVYPKLLFKLR